MPDNQQKSKPEEENALLYAARPNVASSGDRYFYLEDGSNQPIGPLSSASLLQAVESSVIQKSTLVVKEGAKKWKPLEEVIWTPPPPPPPASSSRTKFDMLLTPQEAKIGIGCPWCHEEIDIPVQLFDRESFR